uniref:Mold-specific protein MS88 n=1 Tax=Ajellomyces capsulatus TaxID=5037 RepID=Q9C1C0_AJECA|nr:mold-specific protein MS88 [Histoplasma capsulatum]
MKSLIAIAGLFLAITAMCQDLSPVFNLSPCPRTCAMETSGRAKEFGCSSGDIACLCKNKEYQRALMECAKKCKPEEIEALAKAGREVCDSAGVSIPPATGADITIPVPTVQLPSAPVPELPSVTAPPLPELPTGLPLPSLPSVPNLPPNAGVEGTTTTSAPSSMPILPIESSDTTSQDPALNPSASAPSSSIDPYLGAANLLSPVHNGVIYIVLLALAF